MNRACLLIAIADSVDAGRRCDVFLCRDFAHGGEENQTEQANESIGQQRLRFGK